MSLGLGLCHTGFWQHPLFDTLLNRYKPNLSWLAQAADFGGLFSWTCGGGGTAPSWLAVLSSRRIFETNAREMP